MTEIIPGDGMRPPRRAGPNLLERSRAAGHGTVGRAERTAGPGGVPESRRAPDAGDSRSALRHCWVIDPPGRPGRWPGVLIGWVSGPDGWLGHVTYVVLDGGLPSVVTEHVPAAYLRPTTNQ